MRILYTPYAPSGKGLSPPAIRPVGLSNTLGALRTLPRMVKDAARVGTPFLRVSAACYGFSLTRNMPVPRGKLVSAMAQKSPQSKQPLPSQQPKGDGPSTKRPESRIENRPSDRRVARERSPRGARMYRGARRPSRRSRSCRRSKMSSAADTLADKRVRDERLAAWVAVGKFERVDPWQVQELLHWPGRQRPPPCRPHLSGFG